MKVKINPDILGWARNEAGFTIEQISNHLDVAPGKYTEWEKSGMDVPWGKLRELSGKYKRQVAVFFLAQTPPVTKNPSDFRNFRLLANGISPETLLAIRRARKFLKLSADLAEKDYWTERYQWTEQITTPEQLRAKLEISLSDQISFKYTSQAFKTWRNCFERHLGVFIFQFALPYEEVQAFCISDSRPFGIVLNSKHSFSGRIFSLFHEAAHLLKNQSSICYHDEIDKNQEIEFSCNDFAGKLLVPDDVVPKIRTLVDLTESANKFKVSAEVILRRNLVRSFITKTLFFDLLAELRKIPIHKRRGGGLSPVDKVTSSRGSMFFSIVTDAMHKNKLDFNTASDVLGLKMNYLMYV